MVSRALDAGVKWTGLEAHISNAEVKNAWRSIRLRGIVLECSDFASFMRFFNNAFNS
jgi:hypothetical protein